MSISPDTFSDYLVFVDESGDHGMATINPDFPLFALAFCVFLKAAYVHEVTPAVRELKVKNFGHDLVILHEHDIRKKAGAFSMMSKEPREAFLHQLTQIIDAAEFTLVVVVIDKRELHLTDVSSTNPYHLALLFGLERVYRLLSERGQGTQTTHFIVEARGKREDTELELEFRRICEGDNGLAKQLPFKLVMADKRTNSEGLQIADMVARPVALSVLRPDQPNRAMTILQHKFWQGSDGQVAGNGLKCFPEKNERPPGSPSGLSPNG
ncbi:MAG: DUF3800 domain-containing protein [Verrucomicrobiaceae bacterium]|nr:DUF3800 domain-containing protein [Verrucomicrobiaceae bacterium]